MKSSELTEQTRADLRAYFAPEYEVYDRGCVPLDRARH